MKRSCSSDMGTPQKRARSLGHELRILIPSRNAGSVIGKAGSNISRLRTENKATITVPDCNGPERLITVAADDQETTFNVLAEIVPLLEDNGSKERGGRNGSEGGGGIGTEVRVLLHHSQVGCVIGKGGGKIKELRESCGAQIKVYGSCCPRSTDRVVAVSGSNDVVLNAVRQIVLLASDSPIKGVNEQYDPHNFDDIYSSQYGGFGESRVGAYGFRSIGGGGGGRDNGRMGGPPRGSRYRNGGGGGGGRDGGRDGGEIPNRRSEGRSGGRHRSGGSGSRGSNGVSRNEQYDDYGDERTTNQVTIPKEFAGAIIGKGGCRIRRIRADSGALITIDEALPGASDRIITISGAPGQIRMAQYLLQQSVKDHGGKTNGTELKEH